MTVHPLRRSCRRPAAIATASALAALLALPAAPALGQSGTRERPFTGIAQVAAVEIVVAVEDAAGALPEDLVPADFEVLEDGVPVRVVGVEVWRRGEVARAAPETGAAPRVEVAEQPLWSWHSVVYLDQVLSGSRSIRRAAEALAAQAGRLTQLGTVEIVVANPVPRVALAPTRSAPLLEQTLLRMARETPGRDALRRIRRQYVDGMLLKGEMDGTGAGVRAGDQLKGSIGPGGGGTGPGVAGGAGAGGGQTIRDGARFARETLARASLTEELLLMRTQHDAMMSWLAGYDASGPRALLLVNDGYDLDPRVFYTTGVIAGGTFLWEMTSNLQDREVSAGSEELAKSLAVEGWVAVNLAIGALETGETMSAEMSGRGRLGDMLVGSPDTVTELPHALVLQPLAPLNRLADATGGKTLTGVNALPRTLESLADRVRLTYQVARPPDGELRRIEVRSTRPEVKVRAPRWSGSTAPEGMAAARARRLLAGGADRGDLPLTAAVALEPAPAEGSSDRGEGAGGRRGKLQARVDLRALSGSLPEGPVPVRVTVGASFAEGEPFVRHDRVDGQTLAGLDAWTYGLPISLPARIERVSVVFEELTTGSWGGAVAAIVEGELPTSVLAAGASDDDPPGTIPADLLPDRKAILILPPEEPVVRGRVLIEPVVASPRVARVDYLLDGAPAGSAGKPPFAARIDFGDLPAPHRVEAVALDAGGAEVGRDALSVNEGVGSFRVRIIEPRSGERIGAVDVEAEVKLPGDPARLERVEVRWNGERVATLFEPPFRTRVYVPPGAPAGYVTVEAHHADGRVAEDVVFLNGTGSGERVEVELVELFTVVQDPMGRPVRGLERTDFSAYEDGAEQALADFRAGTEMPLSLGLLMDTSASMTPALRAAQTAAIDFLLLALRSEGDRAFVVGFDSRPRLVQPLTGARDELVDAIAGLRPGGTSALCDALVFSLVEMQTVPGRRALVVLTDGVGREERIDFGTCLRFVQRSGIPIYAILLAGDDPTAERRGGVDLAKLGPLVEAVGGRAFVAEDVSRLGEVYRAVIEELRSQYLLTYYPRRAPAAAGERWREVEVEVGRAGLVARTVAGYYR